MTDIVPVWRRPTYPGACPPTWDGVGRLVGLGGSVGFGKLRRPRPLKMRRRLSGIERTAVGYQAVGTKPSTAEVSSEMSTTAVALASEQTTKSFDWSAFIATALGVMPNGWRAVIETLMFSASRISRPESSPTTYTLLVFAAATKIRCVNACCDSLFSAALRARITMSVGCCPRRMKLMRSPVSVLCFVTVPSTQLDTKYDFPS